MNKLTKQLKRHATDAKLSAAEKRELKARVVSYMEYHPRAEKVAVQKAQAYIESQPYTVIQLSARYFKYGFAAFAMFAFVILPTVAENSVPGDVLYPIKVNVNEEVRGSLTFSKTQKIEWETERLERRISEVRLLESEGKLTDEVEAQVVEAVQAHAKAAQAGIAELKTTDVDEASLAEVTFSSALQVQSAVLAKKDPKLTESEANDMPETGLAQVVREAQETVDATRGSTTPSYEKTMARLEIETTQAYELFAALDEVVSQAERAEIERRLADIERKIAAGQDTNDMIVTELHLQALSDTRKLISFMTDIDVRTNVPLQTLIPVTLTEEERSFAVAETIVAAELFLENWAAFTDSAEFATFDTDLADKVVSATDELELLLEDFRVASTSALAVQETKAAAIGSLAQKLETIIMFETDGRATFAPEPEPVATTTASTTVAVTTESGTTTSAVEGGDDLTEIPESTEADEIITEETGTSTEATAESERATEVDQEREAR